MCGYIVLAIVALLLTGPIGLAVLAVAAVLVLAFKKKG